MATNPEIQAFKQLVRTLHLYLKAHHHLGNIQISGGNIQEPPSLRRVVGTLETTIKPANTTDHTQLMLMGNARNWLHNSLQILEDHYQAMVRETEQTLRTSPLHDWKHAWEIAIRWNKRNLRNIKQTTIDMATIKITEFINSLNYKAPIDLNTTSEQIPETPTLTTNTSTNQSNPTPNHPTPNQVTTLTLPQPVGTSKTTTHNLPPTTANSDPQLPTTCPAGFASILSPQLSMFQDDPSTTFKLQLESDQESIGPHQNEPNASYKYQGTSPKRKNSPPLTRETKKRRMATPNPSHNTSIGDQRPSTSTTTTTTTTTRPPPAPLNLYTKHDHYGDKYKNFILNPQRPILILGDSNLDRFPKIEDPRIQVDCYPGALLSHATNILKHKTPTNSQTQRVILSFGLNNRDQTNPSLLADQLKRLLQAARDTFPQATIGIPVLNYSHKFLPSTKQNIESLNFLIRDTGLSIPPLASSSFKTAWDKIHWTKETGELMAKHWLQHLNLD